MTQHRTGWIFIATALALMLFNMSDAIKDLQTWHGATTPQFFAIVLKQGATVALSALGGKMLNPFGDQS